MPEAELYLVGGALLFYLLDSVLLLYGDELLFATGLRGWHNVGGGLLLFGRRALLPNPLLPGARLLRVCWSASSATAAGKGTGTVTGAGQSLAAAPEVAEADTFRAALRPLQFGVVALLLLIGAGLPAVLYAFGQGLPLLVLLAAIYALDLSMAAWLWRARTALRLGGRAAAFLTVDLLLCPPFAINLVRKIALQQQPVGDPLAFAHTRFGAAQFRALCALLRQRVNVELAGRDSAGSADGQLALLLRRLEELAP